MQLFGGATISCDDQGIDLLPGHQADLVARLALLSKPCPTEVIQDWLWPEADLETGQRRLRNLLNRLRERAGPVVLRQGLCLRLALGATVDVHQFRAAALQALLANETDPSTRARLSVDALALYSDEVLPAQLYDDWAIEARCSLAATRLALVQLLVGLLVDCGENAAAHSLAVLFEHPTEYDSTRWDSLHQKAWTERWLAGRSP